MPQNTLQNISQNAASNKVEDRARDVRQNNTDGEHQDTCTKNKEGKQCGVRQEKQKEEPKNKLITYAIPCYNSADYMDKCIESILACKACDIEIIVVDDGSTKDNTFEKACAWQEKYPDIIRAIHQENGGHGAAVMTGLKNASGEYFKVVDSDDWLDNEAHCKMLEVLRQYSEQYSDQVSNECPVQSPVNGSGAGTEKTPKADSKKEPLDLLLVNYVYEHALDGTTEVMDYKSALPQDCVFRWEQAKHWKLSQYILMHSVVYRTQILQDCKLDLPHHTFYVDNIFIYVPLPFCKRLYYLDVDLYRYYIGRDDQSVNESVMIGRIDQQLRVTRCMIDAYHLQNDVPSIKLREYMYNYLAMMMMICTVFSMLSERADKEELRDGIWKYLKEHDEHDYKKIRHGIRGRVCHLPGKLGDSITLAGYHVAQKVFKFN